MPRGSSNSITIGCTATDFLPLRGSKPAREPGVNGKGFGPFGWLCASGLGAGLGSQARLIW